MIFTPKKRMNYLKNMWEGGIIKWVQRCGDYASLCFRPWQLILAGACHLTAGQAVTQAVFSFPFAALLRQPGARNLPLAGLLFRKRPPGRNIPAQCVREMVQVAVGYTGLKIKTGHPRDRFHHLLHEGVSVTEW
jgi:hypothetical protein